MEKLIRKDAFRLLREMTLTSKLNESVRRSIRLRLEVICEAEEKSFAHWKEHVQHKLKPTHAAQVRRIFEKRIKAYKIVIHDLTPYFERGPEPKF